jgi:hypothetical protein
MYIPNIEYILSKEAVKKFCKYWIDIFTIESIEEGSGFSSTNQTNPMFGNHTFHSHAFTECSSRVDNLVTEDFLREFTQGHIVGYL